MDWKSISNEEESKELLRLFGEFHDACIKEAHMWTGHSIDESLSMTVVGGLDTSIKFVVQRQFRNPSCIELLFEEVTRINFVPSPENYDSIIYECNLGYENEQFYWVIDTSQEPSDLNANEDSWVRSKKLSWRIADDLLGSELHYGNNT